MANVTEGLGLLRRTVLFGNSHGDIVRSPCAENKAGESPRDAAGASESCS